MKCPICNSNQVKNEYDGPLRDGKLGQYTQKSVKMFRCENCGVIWHEPYHKADEYYESKEYREQLEGSSEIRDFYRLHDKENFPKLTYADPKIFRNKTIADVGCGGGAFLDLVSGVAKETIAIEPSEAYRDVLSNKGYKTYAYASDAVYKYVGKIDVLTSFDVIEHVEDPVDFIKGIKTLSSKNSIVITGTPTEAPFMRHMLVGGEYEKQILFTTQHLWIFNEESLKRIAILAGYSENEISFK